VNFDELREPLAALGVQLRNVPSPEHARDGRCKSCGVRGLKGVVVKSCRAGIQRAGTLRSWERHIADVCSSDCAMAMAIEHRLLEDSA